MKSKAREVFDVSRWARRRLAERVVPETASLSYIIPDGLVARIAAREMAAELLGSAMDAVLIHDPCTERILFELHGGPRGDSAVFVFERHGGTGTLCAADRIELDRKAARLRARVEVIQASPDSISALVALPLEDASS